MTCSWKWMTAITLSLVLSWQVLPASAQTFESDEAPAPLEAEQDVEPAGDDGAAATTEEEPAEMPADESYDAEATNDAEAPATLGDEQAAPVPMADEQPTSETEVIKERYPNGSVKIEREVTQDDDGNYVNHGMFKTFDERGNLTAQGEYRNGKRQGNWIRWYRGVAEAKLLAQAPYQQFPGPFISQATFNADELDGAWTIFDGKKRKISEWQFKSGRRNGPSTWWYTTGRKMREMNFQDGELEGAWIEWRPDGSITAKEAYHAGRKQAMKVSHHQGGAKKTEGMYLFAKEIEETPDDWWQCKPMTLTRTGKDERHGTWTAWYANGQRQQEGNYEHDMQSGTFVWWHPNGQKALQGTFASGKQDGRWTWWYASGQKSIQGEYTMGNPTGRWTWWKEDGKVAQSADLSLSEGVAIEMPTVPDTKPQAKLPTKPRPTVKR